MIDLLDEMHGRLYGSDRQELPRRRLLEFENLKPHVICGGYVGIEDMGLRPLVRNSLKRAGYTNSSDVARDFPDLHNRIKGISIKRGKPEIREALERIGYVLDYSSTRKQTRYYFLVNYM